MEDVLEVRKKHNISRAWMSSKRQSQPIVSSQECPSQSKRPVVDVCKGQSPISIACRPSTASSAPQPPVVPLNNNDRLQPVTVLYCDSRLRPLDQLNYFLIWKR